MDADLQQLVTQEAIAQTTLYNNLVQVSLVRKLTQSEKFLMRNLASCLAQRSRYMQKAWSQSYRSLNDGPVESG